ncbi:uncharacterized protein CCOS01_07368 [Colletotrichum costaricense]|uniref:Secreted protein n=1 Tax=Colletotrichum costaricense TaxID=1209916 RepID=A0AAI9YXK4_9PEZI|nr:uncharacterized protein CCOS01_07368 [Colletotrichum costaricense]KAK1527106.1 hypothetical protein CCOS01_07368 [Colletotrichum costaricense]
MPQSGLLISLFLLISTHSVLVSLFSTKQAVPSNSTRCHSFHFLPSPPSLSLFHCLALPCYSSSQSRQGLLLFFPCSFTLSFQCHLLGDILFFFASKREQREGERTRGFVKAQTNSRRNH